MQRTNRVKIIGFVLLFISIISLIISQTFEVNFVENHIRTEGLLEQSKMGVYIFQAQMFGLGIFFLIFGFAFIIFNKGINALAIKRKNLLYGLLIIVGILILSTIAGEIILRFFFSNQIYSEYGHGPGWKKLMNKVEYNSFGYRDVEHTLQKDEKTFRIVILGDSFTFGAGIWEVENIYPRLLQKKFDDSEKNKVEVISLAKGGYSTTDELRILNNLALNLSPDLIVLAYFANDAEGPSSRVGFENLYFQHYMIPYVVGGWLYEHSMFYYFLESRIKNIIRSWDLESKSYYDYTLHLFTTNPFLERHKKMLTFFIKIAQKNDIPVIVMHFPSITSFDKYPYLFVNDFVREIVTANNSTYLDLLPGFSKYDSEELQVSFMDGHINEFGHNLTAQILYETIEEGGFIKNVRK